MNLKQKQPRKRLRVHLKQSDRERIGFTDKELKAIADGIRQEAAGNTCGNCSHAVFGDFLGMCLKKESVLTGGALRIESRGATACKQWERK